LWTYGEPIVFDKIVSRVRSLHQELSPGATAILLAALFFAGSFALMMFVHGQADEDPRVACTSYCKARGKQGKIVPMFDASRYSGMENKGGAGVCRCL